VSGIYMCPESSNYNTNLNNQKSWVMASDPILILEFTYHPWTHLQG